LIKHLLLPLLAALVLPTAVNADEFEDNWFNEAELKIQLGKTHSIDPTELTTELVDQAKSGACEAYVEFKYFPSKEIESDCKRIFKTWNSIYKYSNSFRNFALGDDWHQECSDARDYSGCMAFKKGKNTVGKPEPNKLDQKRRFVRDDGKTVIFDPKSVIAYKVRGEYGRYIKFQYRLNYYKGSVSVPGYQKPSTATTTTFGNTSYTTINQGQNVGGFTIPGGMRAPTWNVEADCEDYTANWKGLGGWRKLKRSAVNDDAGQLALDIMDEFCPQMNKLVSEAKR
tara:strand:+ start:340 stop:1191 length:852 start_codon:yes stop_codon:yes gene_type:complete